MKKFVTCEQCGKPVVIVFHLMEGYGGRYEWWCINCRVGCDIDSIPFNSLRGFLHMNNEVKQ